MTRFEVLVSREARAFLDGLSDKTNRRFHEHLERLRDDPFRPRPGADIRRLKGGDDPPLFRLRVGDYRVLYFVVGREVRVTEILHRSRAYRGME